MRFLYSHKTYIYIPMKKTFLLAITALVALMAASCQKEELGRVLTATIEQYEHSGNAKAYINNDNYACWENNDRVNINGNDYPISISEGEHNYTASIEGQIPTDQDLLAFYPASMVSNLSATGGTVTLPHLQTYETTIVNGVTYQKIQNPMAAYCPADSNKLKFRNLCSLLKVTLPDTEGSKRVKSITVKGISGQMLCGSTTLQLSSEGHPILGNFSDGCDSVTLQDINVVLNGSKSFYIVVPPFSIFKELTLSVVFDEYDNGIIYQNRKTNDDFGQVLGRNHIGAFSYAMDGEENIIGGSRVILYTAGSIATPSHSESFNATIVSNTFNNGKGVILFDQPITSIGNNAFQDCSSLTSISLPESLTSIGNNAFAGCDELTSITLPAGVTTIGKEAFYSCRRLTSISLPTNLTSIGDRAFYGCDELASIDLPAGVTSIGNKAFSYCSSLTSITLPTNLTSIKDETFSYCSSLTSISLPAGVTSIGIYAFNECSSLTRVECHAITPPNISSYTFEGIPSSAELHVPSGREQDYRDSYFWRMTFDNNIFGDL